MLARFCKLVGSLMLLFAIGFVFLNYGMASSAGLWKTSLMDQINLSTLLATMLLSISILVISFFTVQISGLHISEYFQ